MILKLSILILNSLRELIMSSSEKFFVEIFPDANRLTVPQTDIKGIK